MADRSERIVSLHAGYEVGGEEVDGYLARPVDGRPRPGVVLLSGMFGLRWTQREITRLYARAGFVALSPDFMGGANPRNATEALRAKNSLDLNRAVEHIVGGADFLRSLPWVAPEAGIGIMGFCLGGGLALLAMARTERFAAGVIYHHSVFPDAEELRGIQGKLLGHYAAEDHSTPREEVEAFQKSLDGLGKAYELHWYEGVGHSFAQIAPDAEVEPERRAATTLSEERSFAFLHRELGGAGAPTGRRTRKGETDAAGG